MKTLILILSLLPAVALAQGKVQSSGITVTAPLTGDGSADSPLGVTGVTGANTGDVTVTAVGAVPNANGASLSGQALTLQPADATNPGAVTAASQTFGGAKTFSSVILTTSLQCPLIQNTLGSSSGDVVVKLGTTVAEASTNSLAKLVSLRTGLGGSETENGYFLKDGTYVMPVTGVGFGKFVSDRSGGGFYYNSGAADIGMFNSNGVIFMGCNLGNGQCRASGLFTAANLVATATAGDAVQVASGGYVRADKSFAGAPTAGDCDAANEKGRMAIDTTNSRFYWCEGTAGWKYAVGN